MAKKTLCCKKPSKNKKTGPIWSTYREVIKTCPKSCKLLNSCYGSMGFCHCVSQKASKRNENVKTWLKSLPEKSTVRHLVTGDLFLDNKIDQEYISEMIEGHKERPDIKGWSYTHDWERLNPIKLSNLNMNASCDNLNDVEKALQKGYDCVTVVPNDFKGFSNNKFTVMICPAQSKNIQCDKCLLCAKKDRKKNRKALVIAFLVHGPKNMIKKIEGLLK